MRALSREISVWCYECGNLVGIGNFMDSFVISRFGVDLGIFEKHDLRIVIGENL